MRWKTGRRSVNIEDRRGRRVARPAVMGGGMGLLVLLGLSLLLGVNPLDVLQVAVDSGGGPMVVSQEPIAPGTPEDDMGQFVAVVLADTEDTWNALLGEAGMRYQEPNLVLFDGAVQSACGFAQSATGPFYCPPDNKVYLDLAFFNDMAARHGASGDFAQAYVIAHEVGHHVQNQLGILPKVNEARQRVSSSEANQLSVMLELQADCFAGVWAHHAQRSRNVLEHGDLEEALDAASSVGDDRLQRQSRGYVVPDSFTHGTSSQRQRWFSLGYQYGSIAQCNTFAADRL